MEGFDMYKREFISGDDVTDADVDAYDRGELIAWRRAGDGTMWYRRTDSQPADRPLIRGVPAGELEGVDGRGDDDFEDDDDASDD